MHVVSPICTRSEKAFASSLHGRNHRRKVCQPAPELRLERQNRWLGRVLTLSMLYSITPHFWTLQRCTFSTNQFGMVLNPILFPTKGGWPECVIHERMSSCSSTIRKVSVGLIMCHDCNRAIGGLFHFPSANRYRLFFPTLTDLPAKEHTPHTVLPRLCGLCQIRSICFVRDLLHPASYRASCAEHLSPNILANVVPVV